MKRNSQITSSEHLQYQNDDDPSQTTNIVILQSNNTRATTKRKPDAEKMHEKGAKKVLDKN